MFLKDLARARVVAVLRAPSMGAAIDATAALIDGGVRAIEITYSTPDAARAIRSLRDTCAPDILIGAGTLVTTEQVAEATEAGAQFLVCPGSPAPLVRHLVETGLPVLAGALTPTEIMAAWELGVTAIKVFPGSLGGPSYLGSLRGPFPDIPFVPTGGVNAANIATWLAAGAVAVGAGSELCPADAMREGRWDEIERKARQFVSAATAAGSAAT